MLKIAHRGNTHGTQPTFENTVGYLRKAWLEEYDVEMDVIGYKGKLYLGHDEPQELAPQEYICSKGTWIHAKNHEAAQLLVDKPNIHWFWHQDDDFALTSKGFICVIWKAADIYLSLLSTLHISRGIRDCSHLEVKTTICFENFCSAQV